MWKLSLRSRRGRKHHGKGSERVSTRQPSFLWLAPRTHVTVKERNAYLFKHRETGKLIVQSGALRRVIQAEFVEFVCVFMCLVRERGGKEQYVHQ